MARKGLETRDRLLDAALDILLEDQGVLTLDAVSKRSGVSKGGLVHHFPTREALVEAVVEAVIDRFAALADRPGSVAEPGPPAEVKAYVDASLEPSLRSAAARMARGLIRLFGSDFRKEAPYLAPWRKLFARRLHRFREAGDLEGFAKAAVITLVIESFVLIDALDLYEFTGQEVDAIKKALLERA